MPWPRIISGLVATVLALVMVILGGWYFTLGFGILVYLAYIEYFELVRAKGIAPAAKTTLVVSLVLLVISKVDPTLADAVLPLAGTFICFYLLFKPKLATIADISASILGLFYVGYLPSYWVRLREVKLPSPPHTLALLGEGIGGGGAQGGGEWLADAAVSNLPLGGYWPESWIDLQHLPVGLTATLLAFTCISTADTCAYIVGKCFGRTRLSDISPKKTVEGAVFGVVGSVVVATVGASLLHWPSTPLTGVAFGLLIGIASLLGDLTESLMKRDAGVKDSGQLIPGHGGILDRADSYMFTGALVYYFVTLLLPLL